MNIVWFIQFFFAVVIGLYFFNLLKGQKGSRKVVVKECTREMEKLQNMRRQGLSLPLAEKTRPAVFGDIIGQEEALEALKAALCGPNPQHVLMYGPPGVGKTAAARLVMEEARNNSQSPFRKGAQFVELDATTARFDERGIADPLIGSVHDPIYQGAGAMGVAGIPQPKPGAVTRAHGGILFIDEIGELHSIQMNKLLKVLEDRKVFLESSYYSEEDENIPRYIHDIFQKGLPADFRLIGATTRLPQDIPPAIRSRCLELFFRSLTPDEVAIIARGAAPRLQMDLSTTALKVIKKYASNGREAVNMVQIGAGIAQGKHRTIIGEEDMEKVITTGQYAPRWEGTMNKGPQKGLAHGLALQGPNMGLILKVEALTFPALKDGTIHICGVIEEEELAGRGHVLKRKSMAKNSLEIVLSLLRSHVPQDPRTFDIHVNFPGGIPIDGPSAGVTLAVAIYSSLQDRLVDHRVAMTGEVTLRGGIKGVGGIAAKIEAGARAGAAKILIPGENMQERFLHWQSPQIIPLQTLEEAFDHALLP